jgi:hypothetical protein
VASIFDLAVLVLAIMVCISMVLLAWTLGVSITRVLRHTRDSIVNARLELVVAERRLRDAAREMAEARNAANPSRRGDE